ncbi:DUF6223 family protein [Chitinophaga sp.]|uniref:DUF6223 family protein n=1 Tax=Chitinophaga sp. TaxID=1869181 RepID=UPI0031DE77C5
MKHILFMLFTVLAVVMEASGNEFTLAQDSKLFNETGYVKGITTARLIGIVELLLGLASVIFAIRSKKRLSVKNAKIALVLGLLAIVFSTVHFITAAGAVFGSGSGKAGAILAFVLGVAGVVLSRSALRRQKLHS